MNRPNMRMGALAALSVALLGCASVPTLDDVAALSLAKGADAKEKPPAIQLPKDVAAGVRQAQTQRKSGDLTGATRTLSQLVLVAPDDAQVLGEYAKTLIAQGRSDDALAFAERAIELQPGDWSLFSTLGVAYDQRGNYPAAVAAYDRALALKPGEPSVLSNSALSHMQAGDLDGAEKLLMQASQSGAEFPRIASNLALVQSLKAAKGRSAPGPVQAAARSATTPIAPPAETVALAPAQPTPPTAAIVERSEPIMSAELPVPAAPAAPLETARPVIVEKLAANPSASIIERLKADPSVKMQAVPRDEKAGKIAKKSPPKIAPPAAAETSETLALRPALSDSKANQQANARR